MSKKKSSSKATIAPVSGESYIKSGRARNLPIDKCYVNANWKEQGMATILVARKHVNGNITSGIYLVDTYCVGVKDAHCQFNESYDVIDEFKEHYGQMGMEIIECDYALAHNIIYSSVAFAEQYGIKPAKDFALAEKILEEDDESIELIEIECGKNGKPFLMSSPEDPRTNYYLAQLQAHAGLGNFAVSTMDEDEDEEDDDDLYDDDSFDENEASSKFPENWNEEDWETFFDSKKNMDSLKEAGDVALYLYEKLLGVKELFLPPVEEKPLQIIAAASEDNEKDEELSNISGMYDAFMIYDKSAIVDIKEHSYAAIKKWPKERGFYILLYNTLFEEKMSDEEMDNLCKDIYSELPQDVIARSMYGLYLLKNGRIDEVLALFHNNISLRGEGEKEKFDNNEMIAFCSLMCVFFLHKKDFDTAFSYGKEITSKEVFDSFELSTDCITRLEDMIVPKVQKLIEPFFDDHAKRAEAINELLS